MALAGITLELAGLKTITAALRPDTCTISRNTPTSDGAGGFTDVWANLATGVSCQVESVSKLRSGGEQIMAAKLTSIAPRVFKLPPLQDVTVKDRIVYSGSTYEVKALDGPLSFEIQVRVYADLVS